MIRHSMHIQNDMFDTLWFVHSVEMENKFYASVRIQKFTASVSGVCVCEYAYGK